MTPLKRSNTIAARMGRWSASHRKTAILGWLAFVVAAAVIGGAVGMQKLDQDELGIRESGRAQQIVNEGDFRDSADESVFVESESATASDPAFRAVVADVTAALAGKEGVSNVRSPLDGDGANLVSADGHAALIQFELADDAEQATETVKPVLGRRRGRPVGEPGVPRRAVRRRQRHARPRRHGRRRTSPGPSTRRCP